MGRVATQNQYRILLMLGGGAAWVVASRRDAESLLRRGWISAGRAPDGERRYYGMLRITPAGLRALADAVERYGLPPLRAEREQAA